MPRRKRMAEPVIVREVGERVPYEESFAALERCDEIRRGMSLADQMEDIDRMFYTARGMVAELTRWERKHPNWPISREDDPFDTFGRRLPDA